MFTNVVSNSKEKLLKRFALSLSVGSFLSKHELKSGLSGEFQVFAFNSLSG